MPNCKIDVDASPTFKRLLESHRKQFPKLLSDIIEALGRIQQDYRKAAGADAIPGFNQTVWKYRCKCSDLRQGTQGGIRIIAYYNAELGTLYPITFYFKRDQSDISKEAVQKIVDELLSFFSPTLLGCLFCNLFSFLG